MNTKKLLKTIFCTNIFDFHQKREIIIKKLTLRHDRSGWLLLLRHRGWGWRLWRLCMDWTGPLALAFDILKRYFHFSCEIRCLFLEIKQFLKVPKTYLFGIGKVKAVHGALFTPLMKMGCSFLLGLKFLIKI